MTDAIPSFLIPYMKSDCLQRLQKVDMNCGVNYTSLPLFKDIRPYTRFDHSLRTALLCWKLTKDRRQALACLFHDCSTPAFSHTIDFLHGDTMHQEYTEEKTEAFIRKDKAIVEQLRNDGIEVTDISDYHIYPICDNKAPCLCCDRLEYTLSNAVNYGFTDTSTVNDIVNDIVIEKNEQNEEELCFKSKEYAYAFCDLSLKCGTIYSSCMDRYAMQRLSEILKQAITLQIISEKDLYEDEQHVISLLENSKFSYLWERYTKLSHIQIFDNKIEGSLNLQVKKRYVDPLVNGKRISETNKVLNQRIQLFLNDKQNEWIKGDTI